MSAFPSLGNASINLSIESPILQPYITTLVIPVSQYVSKSLKVFEKVRFATALIFSLSIDKLKELTCCSNNVTDEKFKNVLTKLIEMLFFSINLKMHFKCDICSFMNLKNITMSSIYVRAKCRQNRKIRSICL